MNPQELFKAGRLDDAVASLAEGLKSDPMDLKARTFLFELLCFQGNYDRALKQVDILAQEGPQSEMGAVLYRGLLSAAKSREETFQSDKLLPSSPDPEPGKTMSGSLNGVPFQSLVDGDPRVGANLEVFAAGAFFLIPFSCLASIEIEPPKRLRDLLWVPAVIRTTPAYREKELGESFLPALTPFASKHPSDAVRLGRETIWEERAGGNPCPVGQKVFLADDEVIPVLEIRKLEFLAASRAA